MILCNRAGVTSGTSITASFSDMMTPSRNFSVNISTTETLTLVQVLDRIRTNIETQSTGWNTLIEDNDLILTSTLPAPESDSTIVTSVTNSGAGNIGLFSQELINGGTRAVAIGDGLRVNASGVLSTDIPALGFVGPTPLREDTANLSNGTLSIITAPDRGAASLRILLIDFSFLILLKEI